MKLGDMCFINEILLGGAQVTPQHLIYAASLKNYEIAAKLGVLYRYSAWPNEHRPAGLNLFR